MVYNNNLTFRQVGFKTAKVLRNVSYAFQSCRQLFCDSANKDIVVTPAPPPYSPPRSQQPATVQADNSNTGISPATRASPVTFYRSSPEPSANASFPTPPPPPIRPRPGTERPQSIYIAPQFARRPDPPLLSPPLLSPPLLSPELHREFTPGLRPHPPAPESLHPSEYQVYPAESRPPASRRAASAGAISTPSSSRSRASSTSRWEPGMPLPPPPPGPPPAAGRSQSMTRSTDRIVSPPTRRPAHLTSMSSLGPVPPTPAGWVDEDSTNRGKLPNRDLHIDTTSVSSSAAAPDSSSGTSGYSGSGSSGLTRQRAVKGEPKSIRERRSESKSGKRVAEEPSNNPWAEAITPSDITVAPLTVLGRRPTITKSTPRSGRSLPTETPRSAEMSNHNTPQATPGTGSRGSTPRPIAPTPPFSPNPSRPPKMEGSPAIPPKALPTPPISKLTLESPGRHYIASNHAPSSAPLINSRPGSRQSVSDQLSGFPAENFARAAIERHQTFSQREAAASSDTERVRIFADFIVAESRLRRERYATAIDAMGSEILELTRDLFRPYSSSRRDSTLSRTDGWTPESSAGPGSRSNRSSVIASTRHDNPQLQSSPNSGSGPPSPALAPDMTWWNNYKPSLSPIPSMSVSEALDGSDSRGRPSSRWWEVSDRSSTGNPSMRLERSKRESKYMGVPKELREKLQYDGDAISVVPDGNSGSAAGPSNYKSLGPDEYPQEKTGLHDQDPTSPPLAQTPAKSPAPFSPQPITPNPKHLDVSRLVTLPPPYPRHHPAVNNNHPDLTSIRTTVRSLSDFTEIEATKSRFLQTSARIRGELEAATSKRRNSMRISIQREIESGNMTFADAAQVEADAKIAEREKTKEASKADFQSFQDQVVTPLNDLLQDRVNRATTLFEQLRSQLSVEAQQQDPNSTQEEGDEQPELLEKLTLLKWIFEAREQLHRELYDLLTDRNDRYKDMVIIPYSLAGNDAKVENAVKFFAADALQRKLKNEQDILKRTEDFMDVIEKNVRDGVEALLNAFWDIAPDLSRITDKVPADLTGFQIQIPAAEYEENPSYFEFPMQYLYSLLGHCEKSTYQFIESQTNLLCLLHEVKSGVTIANCKLITTQRVAQGEGEEAVERELKEVERDEEMRLTDDLKEKVRCVEELWSSGLGTELKGVKERIVGFLVEQGGWVEDVE